MKVCAVVMMMMVVVEGGRDVRQASRCRQRESCTPLRSCRTFQELLRRPDAAIIRRIQGAICNRDRRNVKVCCPGASDIVLPVNTTLPIRENPESLLPRSCGRFSRLPSTSTGFLPARRKRQNPPFIPGLEGLDVGLAGGINTPTVVEGDDVKLTQPLSWMALLGYNSRVNPVWACGGSLITDQYVITAAHCIHNDFTQGLRLEVIRLGELNLKTERDCENNGIHLVCAPPPQDFSPAQIIIHQDFNKRTRVSDEIALIRLDRKASFGQFVFPICLPPRGTDALTLVANRGVDVSGWGLTETAGSSAQILQKARLPPFDKAQCNRIYNNTLIEEQLCFGGGRQDSCQGDSGGPIFIRRNLAATLIGLVSRGLDFRCGTEGVPAVYTDVTAYRPWVLSNIRE